MAFAEATRPAAREQGYERGSFSGSASEYFGIWIVNILLTIITIGIYSAWAKVRRKRYFYGNTVLMGRAFEYHARGMQIFIGRLIVFGFIIVVNILVAILPLLAIIVPLAFLFLLPWIVKRSLRFNARVTSYRNVRFDFVGSTGGAFVAIILGGLVAVISLGILAPLATRWVNRYLFNNLRYGDRPFATDPKLGAIYMQWLIPALMIVVGAIILGVIGFSLYGVAITMINEMDPNDVNGQLALVMVAYLATFAVLIVYGLGGLIYRAGVRNVVWSSTLFDGKHELKSDLSRLRYAWIIISNVIVTMLTFGLMRPWAAVREARYVAEHSAIRFNGEIGEVFSSIEASGAAISAEYMDMEGFDFGF